MNEKLKYPIVNKKILSEDIKKFVKKMDLFSSNNLWCKWSVPALKGFCLFFSRIILIDKNSKTKIAIDHASKMGWINFWLAKYIKINEIIKPNSKLPLSPKNSFGSPRREKLKHKKIIIGINIIIRNNWKFLSGTKKYRITNTEIVVKLSVPFIPSK